MNLPSSFRCLCIPTAIIFAASIALLIFVALPLQEKITTESDEIQKFHAKVENSQRKIARLPELGSQFSIVKEDERKISRLLPESRAVDLIEEIEEIARAVGGDVSIKQGSAIEVAKKKPASKEKNEDGGASGKASEIKTIVEGLSWEKRLPLRVTFSGEYAKSVNFLHKIETISYRLDVVSIDIRPIVPEEKNQRGSDVFAAIPIDGAEPMTPIEPEKPLVSATFDLVIYME